MSTATTLTPALPGTGGSGLKRYLTVMTSDYLYQARRPATLIWIVVLVLCAWGMSQGAVAIQSGDATVGGTKSWITSEFALAMQISVLTLLFYTFFLAI